jgi:hypothetical protein
MGGSNTDDVYVIRAGGTYDEPDHISEFLNAGIDTIRLEGLTPSDVEITESPNRGTLHLALKAADGSVTYTDFYADLATASGSYGERIEVITFDDGTVWDLREG